MAQKRSKLIRLTNRILLAVFALSFLGTSRILYSKELVGRIVVLPKGVEATAAPAAFFGENVNNQGCAAPQRVDLGVALRLKNNLPNPIRIETARAVIIVDGEKHAVRPNSWVVGDTRFSDKPASIEIAPGATETVLLISSAFLAKPALSQADRIEIELPIASDRSRVVFEGVRSVALSAGRRGADGWRQSTLPR